MKKYVVALMAWVTAVFLGFGQGGDPISNPDLLNFPQVTASSNIFGVVVGEADFSGNARVEAKHAQLDDVVSWVLSTDTGNVVIASPGDGGIFFDPSGGLTLTDSAGQSVLTLTDSSGDTHPVDLISTNAGNSLTSDGTGALFVPSVPTLSMASIAVPADVGTVAITVPDMGFTPTQVFFQIQRLSGTEELGHNDYTGTLSSTGGVTLHLRGQVTSGATHIVQVVFF